MRTTCVVSDGREAARATSPFRHRQVPGLPSLEIVVKEFDLDRYKGYCLRCGVDLIGVLVEGTTSGQVVKDGD